MWTFFFFQWLSENLSKKLVGFRFGEIFSQNKDELIIGFYNDNSEDFYWVLNFDSTFPHMKFYDSYSRAKKNTVNLFNELLDLEITNITQHPYERSFHFSTNSDKILVFKLHGAKSNIILISDSETLLFRNNLLNDFEIVLDDFSKNNLELENLELKTLNDFRFLDKYSKKLLSEKGFDSFSADLKKQLLEETLELANKNKAFLFQINGKYQIHKLEIDKVIETYSDPFQACNQYSSLEGKERFLLKEKSLLQKSISNQISKSESAIEKMKLRLESLKNSSELEEKANLIMSNLHLFKDQEEAEVFNYYRNQNCILKIKKGMSPQKFAETLYRKNKNKGIEIKNLEDSIQKAELKSEKNQLLIEELLTFETPKELKNWLKNKNLIKEKNDTESALPFKKFLFQGYDILVGQNSKKNDTLTTQYASKNDIWMHAKDVSGSHVVIKRHGQTNIPKDVLEEAASIAAWFSKGRSDTYFPVIYTEKKYVRKSKGMASGQVKVDQHDVIIVKPKKPE